jgi:hypothetical protein
MDSDPLHQGTTADPELIEIGLGRSLDVVPVLHRPVAQMHSPMAEHRRSLGPLSSCVDRPTLRIPSAHVLARSLALAVTAAVPCLPLLGWQVAVIAGLVVVVTREVDGQVSRASFRFADGFIPPMTANGGLAAYRRTTRSAGTGRASKAGVAEHGHSW